MRGIRGIKRCQCGDYDVFGWHGTRKPDIDEGAGPQHDLGFETLAGIKMPAVNAPFSVPRGSFVAGQLPPTNNAWAVGLPTHDDYLDNSTPGAGRPITGVIGARVTNDTNGHRYVTYITGRTNEATDLTYDEGELDVAIGFTCVEFDSGDVIAGGTVPPHARFSPYLLNARWLATMTTFSGGTSFSGGNANDMRLFGFSRNGNVRVDGRRGQRDGKGIVVRYQYSTAKYGVGFAESAATADGAFICLPAQQAEGGNAWVLAKDYNSLDMYTGIWTNNLCYTTDDPAGPLVGLADGLPDRPAVLTHAEQANRISMDDQLGGGAITNWIPIAYTRSAGCDYILADFYNIDGLLGRWYWDGRLGHWYVAEQIAGGSGAQNLYAFDNGDVVLAHPRWIRYYNADRSLRWQWDAPGNMAAGFPPTFSAYEGPCISGNDEWVQIKNVAILSTEGVGAFLWVTPAGDVDAASTAAIDAAGRGWCRKTLSGAEPAVSLSRMAHLESTPPQPVCVVHRAVEHGRWDDTAPAVAPLDPVDLATWPYTPNLYASEETLNERWEAANQYRQSHRQLHRDVDVGGQCFDAVPSGKGASGCKCGCQIPSSIPY